MGSFYSPFLFMRVTELGDMVRKPKKKTITPDDLVGEEKPKRKKRKKQKSEGKEKDKSERSKSSKKDKETSKSKSKSKSGKVTKTSKKETHKKRSKKTDIAERAVEKQLPDSIEVIEASLDQFVEDNPYVREHEQFQQYRNMFDKLSMMIVPFEKQAMEGNQRAVYALDKLYNQMREVIADIRSLKDVQQMADILAEEVLTPLAKSYGAEFLLFRQNIDQYAKKTLPPEMLIPFTKKIDEFSRAVGQSMQEGFATSLSRLDEVLEEQ